MLVLIRPPFNGSVQDDQLSAALAKAVEWHDALASLLETESPKPTAHPI